MTSILHITASTGGGAGRAVARLHQGLVALGCESRVLCVNDPAGLPGAVLVEGRPGGGGAERWLALSKTVAGPGGRTSISNTLFSLGYPGHDLAALDIVRRADVIHLHWTPRILSIRGVEDILRLRKPTFWTLHDLWPVTAGQHYPASDHAALLSGAETPHLREGFDLTALLLEDKRRSFDHDNLTVVTLGETCAARCRAGSIFAGRRIETAFNGVDTARFAPQHPAQRSATRRMLGIEDDCVVALLMSQDVREKRKGFGHVAQALAGADGFATLARLRDAERLIVMTIGARGSAAAFPGFRTLALDPITDDARLAATIGLADVMIAPAVEETFSLVVLEGWACGVPAIAPRNGGITDAWLETGVNGVLAEGRPDARALALALERFCADDVARGQMRRGARRTAEAFSLEAAAVRMLEIYGLAAPAGETCPMDADAVAVAARQTVVARIDPRPSHWLADRMVEPAIRALIAETTDGDRSARPAGPAAPSAPAKHPAPVRQEWPAASAPTMQRLEIDLTPRLKTVASAQRLEDGAIALAARVAGHAIYGCHLDLEPGFYRVTADLTLFRAAPLLRKGRLRRCVVECVYDRDERLAQTTFDAPLLGSRRKRVDLFFEIDAPRAAGNGGFEFRLWSDSGVKARLEHVALTGHSIHGGPGGAGAAPGMEPS